MTPQFLIRIVPRGKIVDYLLNLQHEAGGSKAVFFRDHGFSLDQVDVMTAALVDHPERNVVEDVATDAWGTRYVVRCRITAPDGRNPCVRTVWMVRRGESRARLVTAYPA